MLSGHSIYSRLFFLSQIHSSRNPTETLPVGPQLTNFCGTMISHLEKPVYIKRSSWWTTLSFLHPISASWKKTRKPGYRLLMWNISHIQKSMKRDPSSATWSQNPFQRSCHSIRLGCWGLNSPWRSHYVVTSPSIHDLDIFSNKLFTSSFPSQCPFGSLLLWILRLTMLWR